MAEEIEDRSSVWGEEWPRLQRCAAGQSTVDDEMKQGQRLAGPSALPPPEGRAWHWTRDLRSRAKPQPERTGASSRP